jgi:hypothetical protein
MHTAGTSIMSVFGKKGKLGPIFHAKLDMNGMQQPVPYIAKLGRLALCQVFVMR